MQKKEEENINISNNRLFVYPSTPSKQNPLEYVYFSVLKQTQTGFGKNERLFWINLDMFRLHYTNMDKKHSIVFRDGNSIPIPKKNGTMKINNTIVTNIQKTLTVKLLEQNPQTKKKLKEWTLIFNNLQQKNQFLTIFTILHDIKAQQYKSDKQKILVKIYQTIYPYTTQKLPPDLQSQKIIQKQKQVKTINQRQEIIIVNKTRQSEMTQNNSQHNKSKFQSNQPNQQIMHESSKKQQHNNQQDNHQKYKYQIKYKKSIQSSQHTNSLYQSNKDITIIDQINLPFDISESRHHSTFNKRNNLNERILIDQHIQSIQYSNKEQLDQINTNSRKKNNNSQSRYNQSDHYDSIQNTKLSSYNNNNNSQKQIDWNILLFNQLQQQKDKQQHMKAVRLYEQFVGCCRQQLQQNMASMLFRQIIEKDQYVKFGIRFNVLNLNQKRKKPLNLNTVFSKQNYKVNQTNNENQYVKLLNECSQFERIHEQIYTQNCFLMERILPGRYTKHNNLQQQFNSQNKNNAGNIVIIPTLMCYLNYAGFNIRCEAVINTINYSRFNQWQAEDKIRKTIQKVQQKIDTMLNPTKFTLHESINPLKTSQCSLLIIQFNPQYILPIKYQNKISQQINKMDDRGSICSVLLSQICYPRTLNQLIKTEKSQVLQNPDCKIMKIETFQKSIMSACIADNCVKLIKYQIFCIGIQYLTSQYTKKITQQEIINGLTEIAEGLTEQWVDLLLSANQQGTYALWNILLLTILHNYPHFSLLSLRQAQVFKYNVNIDSTKRVIQQLRKKYTIGGFVLACILDILNMKMWRYKTILNQTEVPLMDFPISLNYHYNQNKILQKLKSSKENQFSRDTQSIFSINIKINKYKSSILSFLIKQFEASLLWQLYRMGLISKWEIKNITIRRNINMQSMQNSQTTKQFILNVLSRLQQTQQNQPSSEEGRKHLPSYLYYLSDYIKLYVSSLQYPQSHKYSKLLDAYNFKQLPLLQYMLYRENLVLNINKQKQFTEKMHYQNNQQIKSSKVKLQQLLNLDQFYNLQNNKGPKQIEIYRQLSPYMQRVKMSRYLMIMKKFIFQNKLQYSKYLFNSIVEETVFWLGDYSITLEPFYIMFWKYYLRTAIQNSPLSSLAAQQSIKFIKSALFMNIVNLGKNSSKVGDMHMQLGDTIVRLTKQGYQLFQNDTKQKNIPNKLQVAIQEFQFASNSYLSIGYLRGYLSSMHRLSSLQFSLFKQEKTHSQSISQIYNSLFKSLQHIQRKYQEQFHGIKNRGEYQINPHNKQLSETIYQLVESVKIIQLLFRICTTHILIQQMVQLFNIIGQLVFIVKLGPSKINTNQTMISEHQVNIQESIRRLLQLQWIYLIKYSEIIQIDTIVNNKSPIFKQNNKIKFLEIKNVIQPLTQYLLKLRQNSIKDRQILNNPLDQKKALKYLLQYYVLNGSNQSQKNTSPNRTYNKYIQKNSERKQSGCIKKQLKGLQKSEDTFKQNQNILIYNVGKLNLLYNRIIKAFWHITEDLNGNYTKIVKKNNQKNTQYIPDELQQSKVLITYLMAAIGQDTVDAVFSSHNIIIHNLL